MKKELKYQLDIQLFAEDDSTPPTPPVPPAEPPKAPEIDYNKLAETITKRSSAAEESALRGMLKEQDLSKDEIEQAVKDFKANKTQKVKDEQERINGIIAENTKFKQEEVMKVTTEEAKKIAKELKVRDDRFDKLMKLCDVTKFTNKDGKFDKEAAQAEMELQLKDVPEFKSNKNIVITTSKGIDVPPAMTDEEDFRRQKYGKSKYFKN